MAELRTIEIDFDIHKLIEAERRSFSETPKDVLRRLLKIPKAEQVAASSDARKVATGSWQGDGVELEHGTELRMEYNKKNYSGRIINGSWVVEGREFSSPSGAASGIALTKKGKPTKLDGWGYWYVKRPGTDNWTRLDDLRPKIADITLSDLGL